MKVVTEQQVKDAMPKIWTEKRKIEPLTTDPKEIAEWQEALAIEYRLSAKRLMRMDRRAKDLISKYLTGYISLGDIYRLVPKGEATYIYEKLEEIVRRYR